VKSHPYAVALMTTATPEGVTVVVPVLNAADRLQVLHERIAGALADVPFELILVNDGSSDASWRSIVELTRDSRVRGIDLMRNYGQHNALLAGIRAARKPVIVTLDDDLQNPPEEIPRLLEAVARGADVVYGTPVEAQRGAMRNLGTWLAKAALSSVVGRDVARTVSAYRAFRTELRDGFADFAGSYVSIDVLLSWGARRFDSVPVAHHKRTEGRSAYTFARLATHALNVLTGFSTRPLRLASLVGIASTVFGLAVLAFVIVRYFTGAHNVPGFAFLASLISIFSGAQLLTLGIMGEYLARMHVRIMDRPPYVVREAVGTDAADAR
jgi:undecaprenyl-phosphate 4-deoxy-4-formamido-L-arabinose transferase